jgi:hypothetical protein
MRIREEFDADRHDADGPTEYETETNRFELPCSICDRTMFVDEATFDGLRRAIEEDLDNRFVCPDCQFEYEERSGE